MLRATAVWLAILVLAVLNGIARDGLIAPRIGESRGRALSSVTLAALIVAVAWVAMPWIGSSGVRSGWAIGALWLALTVCFEFLGGHYLFGTPWRRLLADYDVLRGSIWVLVLLATLFAPVWASRVLRR
jgi:hypothetical protein